MPAVGPPAPCFPPLHSGGLFPLFHFVIAQDIHHPGQNLLGLFLRGHPLLIPHVILNLDSVNFHMYHPFSVYAARIVRYYAPTSSGSFSWRFFLFVICSPPSSLFPAPDGSSFSLLFVLYFLYRPLTRPSTP